MDLPVCLLRVHKLDVMLLCLILTLLDILRELLMERQITNKSISTGIVEILRIKIEVSNGVLTNIVINLLKETHFVLIQILIVNVEIVSVSSVIRKDIFQHHANNSKNGLTKKRRIQQMQIILSLIVSHVQNVKSILKKIRAVNI